MSSTISRRAVVAGLSGAVAAGLAAPHIARAAVRIARFGHNNTDQSHFGRGLASFADAVAADPALSGVIKIEVHGNAELGDELGLVKACAAGTLDGALCGNPVVCNVVPEFGLLNAPFLFRDTASARAALDGAVGAEFTALARAKDVQVLAWGENGLRHITSNRPIRTPADVSGLKIRVPQSEIMLGGFKALGADAAPLSFSLLREALRTGQFQAQENSIANIELNKLYEFQKYLSLTGHIYDPAIVISSTDLLDDLSEPQRAALITCAQKGAQVMRHVSETAEQSSIARLTSSGMTVVTDVDVAAFRAASRPYLEGLSATYGSDRMKRLMAAGA